MKAEAPDLLIFDGMFPAALAQAKDFGKPTVAVSHTFVFRMLDRWRGTTNALLGMRQQAGFDPLPDLDALWHGCDRILVTTLGEFDNAALAGWESLRHVGPVLEDEKVAVPTALPWSDETTPLALMSFSTGFEQRSLDKLQRGLDAIADLPLNVVVTTGGIVDPAELKAPRNAFVVNYAAHDPIIARAALVITHGGHGTAMRALKHGVPMIVMPGLAHDQAVIAGLMEEWGTGIAMSGDVAFGSAGNAVAVSRAESVEALRNAVQKILATPSYRANAQKRAVDARGDRRCGECGTGDRSASHLIVDCYSAAMRSGWKSTATGRGIRNDSYFVARRRACSHHGIRVLRRRSPPTIPMTCNVIIPLTGGGAFLGKAEQQALDLAVGVINKDGGIHGKKLQPGLSRRPVEPASRGAAHDRGDRHAPRGDPRLDRVAALQRAGAAGEGRRAGDVVLLALGPHRAGRL